MNNLNCPQILNIIQSDQRLLKANAKLDVSKRRLFHFISLCLKHFYDRVLISTCLVLVKPDSGFLFDFILVQVCHSVLKLLVWVCSSILHSISFS